LLSMLMRERRRSWPEPVDPAEVFGEPIACPNIASLRLHQCFDLNNKIWC
jgi:hypothetical protein